MVTKQRLSQPHLPLVLYILVFQIPKLVQHQLRLDYLNAMYNILLQVFLWKYNQFLDSYDQVILRQIRIYLKLYQRDHQLAEQIQFKAKMVPSKVRLPYYNVESL